MIDRYPAPIAKRTFSDVARRKRWLAYTKNHMMSQIERLPTSPDRKAAERAVKHLVDPSAAVLASNEVEVGHDVVAFLLAIEDQIKNTGYPEARKYLHYGLTSSDLVDNAHFDALNLHATNMVGLMYGLIRRTRKWDDHRTPRAGRTHGQIADVTSWRWQMRVHHDVLIRIHSAFEEWTHINARKSPGPTGTTPLLPSNLGFPGVVRSTQVIPRDYQLEWANLYLRLATELEAIATLIRCGAREEVGELAEGSNRIGSSSMPLKRNPIDSEKVCGLARLARGYFMTIAENCVMWDDRDISNSSVERIAVPDLAATVEHMLNTMTNVLDRLVVDGERMHKAANSRRTMPYYQQALAQKHFGMGPVEAGNFVRRFNGFQAVVSSAVLMEEFGLTHDQVIEWSNDVALTHAGELEV